MIPTWALIAFLAVQVVFVGLFMAWVRRDGNRTEDFPWISDFNLDQE